METYKIAPHAAWRRVEDEIVVLDLNTSVYYSLSESGARAWELLAESLPVEKIAERLTEEYEVSAKAAERDVRDLVGELRQEKLLLASRG
ncbi:MAG: PqqD family protein [Elusimicrobia bacterium]|nr:PqqD family protein [Elusimicrobiota bacterium]